MSKVALYPYQQQVVAEALETQRGCIFHIGQGLGKTPTSVHVLMEKWNRGMRKFLIVVTAPKCIDWKEEIENCAPELSPHVGILETNTSLFEHNITIGSYQMVAKKLEEEYRKTVPNAFRNPKYFPKKIYIYKKYWEMIILDESQNIKSHDAKRTIVLMPVLHKADFVLLLTGTLMSNAPHELYTQVDAVSPNLLGSWEDYIVKFCEGYYDEHFRRWEYKGSDQSMRGELNQILDTVRIRRKKEDCLDLPPRRRMKVFIPTGNVDELTAVWDEFRELCKIPKEMMSRKQLMELQQKVLVLAHKSAWAKMPAFLEWLDVRLSLDSEQMIIFCSHDDIAKHIVEWLQAHSISNFIINAKKNNTKEKRAACVKSFQNGESRIAVLGLRACCEGLNMTPCFRTAYVEFNFSPGDLMQAECRTDRIGAVHQTEHYYFVGIGSYEPRIMQRLGDKDDVINEIGDDQGGEFQFDTTQEFCSDFEWGRLHPNFAAHQRRLTMCFYTPGNSETVGEYLARAGKSVMKLYPSVPHVVVPGIEGCVALTSSMDLVNDSDVLCLVVPR